VVSHILLSGSIVYSVFVVIILVDLFMSLVLNILSPGCSACGSRCPSYVSSEMDLCRTSKCFGCHTR
jgi:hypothetical protein